MSVTFSAYNLSDIGEVQWLAPVGWYPQYEDDPDYGRMQVNQNPLELNVSNSNFYSIMELLGYESPEYCGAFGDGSLQDLIERINFCLSSVEGIPELDGGTLTTEGKGQNGATWIDCGRRVGYYRDRLTQLKQIAVTAWEKDATVSYA